MLNNKVILERFKKFFSDYSEKIGERTNSLLIIDYKDSWTVFVRIKRWNLYVEHCLWDLYFKVLITPKGYNLSTHDYIPPEEREECIAAFLYWLYKELVEEFC